MTTLCHQNSFGKPLKVDILPLFDEYKHLNNATSFFNTSMNASLKVPNQLLKRDIRRQLTYFYCHIKIKGEYANRIQGFIYKTSPRTYMNLLLSISKYAKYNFQVLRKKHY